MPISHTLYRTVTTEMFSIPAAPRRRTTPAIPAAASYTVAKGSPLLA
jgi:hypothetical protein